MLKVRSFVVAAVALMLSAGLAAAGEPNLTFFGWSDQHVDTKGNADHLKPAVEAMNNLPGKAYPEKIGGSVETPALVFGAGDITEWPTAAAKDAYNALITKEMKFPAYDIMGNHDTGGKVTNDAIKNWIIQRHGALSYTFDKGGVHFIAVDSEFDPDGPPEQAVTAKALDFIKADLAKLPKGTPVIVAMHLCYESMTNRDALVDAFGDANVILVLGGHYHYASLHKYRGINFMQLPSPTPKFPSEVTVIRIAEGRLVALPYNYSTNTWNEKKMLDVPVKSPGVAATAPADTAPR